MNADTFLPQFITFAMFIMLVLHKMYIQALRWLEFILNFTANIDNHH